MGSSSSSFDRRLLRPGAKVRLRGEKTVGKPVPRGWQEIAELHDQHQADDGGYGHWPETPMVIRLTNDPRWFSCSLIEEITL